MTRRGVCADCGAEATHVLYWLSASQAHYTRTLLCDLHWERKTR